MASKAKKGGKDKAPVGNWSKPVPSDRGKAPTAQSSARKDQGTPHDNPKPVPGGRKFMAEAPFRPSVHDPIHDVAKRAAKEFQRAKDQGVKATLEQRLKAGAKLSADELEQLSATTLGGYCKANPSRFPGYSALKKDELVKYIATGRKPVPEKDSARYVAENLKVAKAAGLVKGPISALTRDAGKALLAKVIAANGAVVTAVKPTPKPGSVDALRQELAQYDRKAVNAFLKPKGRSYSSAKKEHIVEALAHFKATAKAA